MATVSAIVARSLRLLRVIDAEDGVPEPFQYVICQEALNDLMARWEMDGIALGWSPVSAPDDVLPAPVEAQRAIAFNLAVEVRPEFGATLDPDVEAMARRSYSDLLRDVTAATHARISYDIPCGESQHSGFYWGSR